MRILMLAAIAALSLGTAGVAQPITTEELKALDTDSDGKVSQPEFDVFLNEAFVKLDANGDKVVTVHEAVVVMTPEQFVKFIEAETARWEPVARAALGRH